MPLKTLLGEGRSLDPKDVAIMLGAYDGVVAELGLRTLEEKEKAARIILQLALDQRDLDAEKLRAGVSVMMQSESAGVHYLSPEGLSSAG